MNNQDDIPSSETPRNSIDSNSFHSNKNNHIVQGPDGNTILCDSPRSSHLPYYTGPDQSVTSTTKMAPSAPSATSAAPAPSAPSACVPDKQESSLQQDINEEQHNNETHTNAPPSPRKPSPNSSKHPQVQKHRSVRRVKPLRVIGNYSLVSTLGSGSMGKVRLAINELNQDKLAVKIVPRVGMQERTANESDGAAAKKQREKDQHREIRTIREASIMLLLHHPYIVSLKEMVVLDPYYYMFMEYVDGGQLLDFIISHGKLKERLARRFARQIVSALDYCHRNSIVHRDLKIENILISRNGHIKIIDFGLSNLFSPRSHLSTFCGSLYFAAPELLNAKTYTGPEVDVWSFGVVLYVLVCGKVPFDDENMAALHDKIKRGVVDYPSHLSSECKNILSRMLVVNPSHRATTAEITVHPWMNKGHSEPVNNYLPERTPLTLPVDMDVVRGMTGFEFGTEEEIKQQLEEIIQSDEYQKAVATLMERQSYRHGSSRSTSLSRRHHSFCLPNDDPQSIPAAYHPLISIYYLVKEHMARGNQQASNIETSAYLTTQSNPGRNISPHSRFREEPDSPSPKSLDTPSQHLSTSSSLAMQQSTIIPMPEAAHAAPPSSSSSATQKEATMLSKGVAYGEKGKINIQVDGDGQITDVDPSQASEPYHGFGRLFNWNHHRRSGGGSETDEHDHNDPLNALQQLTQVVTRSSFEKRQHRQRRHTIDDKTTVNNISNLVPQASTSSNNGNGSTNGSEPQHLQPPDRLTINTKTTNTNSIHNHDETSLSAGTKRLGRTFSKMLSRKSMPASAHPPPSAPPQLDNPPAEPHHHLQHFGHRFSKSSSLHSHMHEQSFPATIDNTPSQNQGTADEQVKPVFLKGLFSVSTTSTKHPSVIRADLIRVLERIGVKWRESKSRFECVHVPSIDMNRVTDTFSPPSQPSVTVPDLVVRFEIYIVKVPWLLGMHGLQFRRVSGDTWQYKNMCSRILAELKL